MKGRSHFGVMPPLA